MPYSLSESEYELTPKSKKSNKSKNLKTLKNLKTSKIPKPKSSSISGDTSASIGTSYKKPPKNPIDYRRQVLEPHGITAGRATDIHAFESVQRILDAIPIEQLKILLGNAYVDFNSHDFASEIACFPHKSEAEWTACIYQFFFLKNNLPSVTSGIKRESQPKLYWKGPSTNICLPPPIHFDRRKSHIPPCEVVWLQDDEKACTPDHFYYVCKQNLEKDLEDLPGFRVGKTYDNCTIACPPYLVTEEKPDKQQEDEARHYIAFVGAALLHEHLLLWHMTDEAQAQDNSAIPFHTFEIYVMTNCAKAVKIFRMFVRPFDETLESTGVRFDMVVVANLDLDREAHGKVLKVWMNFIHHWGLTVHTPEMIRKGREVVSGTEMNKQGWDDRISSIAFFYDTATKIKFKIVNKENNPLFNSDSFDHPEEAGTLDNASNEISANSEEIVSSEDTRISAENFAQSRPTKEKAIAHSVLKNLVLTTPAKNNPTKTSVTSVSSTNPLPAAVSKGRPISIPIPKPIARDPQPTRGSKLALNCIRNPLREIRTDPGNPTRIVKLGPGNPSTNVRSRSCFKTNPENTAIQPIGRHTQSTKTASTAVSTFTSPPTSSTLKLQLSSSRQLVGNIPKKDTATSRPRVLRGRNSTRTKDSTR
ncbi:hypothetical protein DL98DRAFT_662650 [Cadophora sp. DSE1049]|nr:hypothetical protein DL98DRAFT_662650 [Cadophora sp. DSE1049]